MFKGKPKRPPNCKKLGHDWELMKHSFQVHVAPYGDNEARGIFVCKKCDERKYVTKKLDNEGNVIDD